MKFPELHTTKTAQEMYTPPEATKQIIPYLSKDKTYWEMCYGRGDMADELRRNGFNIVGEPDMDCFKNEPSGYDVIITNPPYRNNKLFLERAIQSNKPFILLMRLEHIGGVKASELLRELDIKILIPERRINFITPKMQQGKKVGGSQFHTVWITHNIVKDSRQIIYI